MNVFEQRIKRAIEIAVQYGGIDGDHHKSWTIDQMVRALTGCPVIVKKVKGESGWYKCEVQGESEEYLAVVADAKAGEDGPNMYTWDEGIAP